MFKKKPFRINTFSGYGTENYFYAKGRALEDENINFASNQNIFSTLKNIYKQLESDEIRNTPVELHLLDDIIKETYTDAEGYYEFQIENLNFSIVKNDENWISYRISFNEIAIKNSIINHNRFNGEMLIPSAKATFGVISDIDDTILHTGVASLLKWKLLVNTLFKNYDKRLPVEGIVTFYRKLRVGVSGTEMNPFFYLSNSPWNLYDYLNAFLRKHQFPKGPVLLRDFRTPFDNTPKPKIVHKKNEILKLLKVYPNLDFILIGDNAEHDTDIYIDIATNFPDRILAIYLRDVNNIRRAKKARKAISKFVSKVPIFIIKKPQDAIKHAQNINLIR